MELIPVATRRTRRRNPLDTEALLDRTQRIIDESTPEPDIIDPTLFSPIERNPNRVNDAITALANARVEGSFAADELRQQQFNDQLQQLILSQFLDVGGAIANLGGSQNQVGINERAAQALPTALNLRSALTDQLIRGAEERARLQGEAGVRTAQSSEEARIANEEDARSQRQLAAEAAIRAQEVARQQGIDFRTALNQVFNQMSQEEQLRQGRDRIDIAEADSITRRIDVLKPSSSRSGTIKRGEKGFIRGLLDDGRGNRAAAQEARTQQNAPPGEGIGAGVQELTRESAAREALEREQLVAENIAQMRGALVVAPGDEVNEVFAELFEQGDNQFILPVIDELQSRLRKNPNDPDLKRLESTINQGAGPDEAVSLQEFLNEAEIRAEAGRLVALQ